MSTVEGKKQEKRRALLDAAYELFLERGAAKTSVEEITSRAKVGKGTFYLYFADKGAVTQALLARVSYQLLDDAVTACEHTAGLDSFPDKMIFVIDHIIEALRKDTLLLRFLERSFVWPGLDQIEASGEAEPLMRKLFHPRQHVHVGVLFVHPRRQTRQHRRHEAGAVRYYTESVRLKSRRRGKKDRSIFPDLLPHAKKFIFCKKELAFSRKMW